MMKIIIVIFYINFNNYLTFFMKLLSKYYLTLAFDCVKITIGINFWNTACKTYHEDLS